MDTRVRPRSFNPTRSDIDWAHERFEVIEPRQLFYRAARELVALALAGRTTLTTAEAIAVLLQTWNANFYRFGRHSFDADHFHAVEGVLNTNEVLLSKFRSRSIHSLGARDSAAITTLFEEFKEVLGAVGAAKALHLLAPEFFPIWDTAIIQAYGLTPALAKDPGTAYFSFMSECQRQCHFLDLHEGFGYGVLKALDEYNYCRFTKSLEPG